MRPYRDIATLAAAQVICFLALTHMEPSFFLLHFYQAVMYMAILIMLFYREDRWLGAGMRQLGQFVTLHAPTNFASFMGAVTAVLALLMIVFNGKLEARVGWLTQRTQYFSGELGNRGHLLCHPGDLVLEHDPAGYDQQLKDFPTTRPPQRSLEF